MVDQTWSVAVHGGAGAIEASRLDAGRAGCVRACGLAADVLASGGTALNAVEMAVRDLEDDPEFNAGYGSVLTASGTVEVDAGIMLGDGLRAGAVGAVPNLRHPISLARQVMEAGEHVLLVSEGALAFALEHGILPEVSGALITKRSLERLELWRQARALRSGGGTVGAVALDVAGHLAAATSTGGMTGKRSGRVGDTPLLGAGFYAEDRAGACSSTGEGEAIIRSLLAHTAVCGLRSRLDPQAAAEAAIEQLARRTGGQAGLILLNGTGGVGVAHNAHNAPYMAFALADAAHRQPRVELRT